AARTACADDREIDRESNPLRSQIERGRIERADHLQTPLLLVRASRAGITRVRGAGVPVITADGRSSLALPVATDIARRAGVPVAARRAVVHMHAPRRRTHIVR